MVYCPQQKDRRHEAQRHHPNDSSHQHQRLLPSLQVADTALVRAVDPPPRIGREKVEHILDPDFPQRGELLLANALQPIDTDRGQFAKGDLAHSTPKR